MGAERVLRAFSVKCWWSKMADLTNEVCAACRACQLAKNLKKTFRFPIY